MGGRASDNYFFHPNEREAFSIRDKAMSGRLTLVLTPATTTTPASTVSGVSQWTRQVTATLTDGSGVVHDWFTGNLSAVVAATSGTATGASYLTLTNGRGTYTVTMSGTVSNAATDTLTVAPGEIEGWATASKTSVNTYN